MDGQPIDFWGKLERHPTTQVILGWHPVIDHCADVAACAEALLTRTILGRRLAQLAQVERLQPIMVSRLCVLVALHDIGKFNAGFQRKWLPDPRRVCGACARQPWQDPRTKEWVCLCDPQDCARCHRPRWKDPRADIPPCECGPEVCRACGRQRRGGLKGKCDCGHPAERTFAPGICDRCGQPGKKVGQPCPAGDGGRVVDFVVRAGHVDQALALFGQNDTMERFGAVIEAETLVSWCGDDEAFAQLLGASIAHHGRPRSRNDVENAARLWAVEAGRDPFAGIAALLAAARTWFPEAFQPGGPPLPATPAFVHGFNGFVSLADWLGSDTMFFPYSEPGDVPRMPWARVRAREALQRVGLDAEAARRGLGEIPVPFAGLGLKDPPRPLQLAIEDLPTGERGSLTIIEAPTGEGKTEAAVWRYLRLFQAGDVDGLYFALPTRTAAQEIFNRINEIRKHAFAPGADQPVIQAVPGYFRVDDTRGRRPSKEDAEARALAPFTVLWDDDGSPGRGWAAENSKRYLAGALVVGTIDQVLLSGLKAKHAHLRAAGLLRLLLVVDEVHASDVYMTAILKGVLHRHRGAGGHALLLSATLGGEARAAYLGEKKKPTLAEAQAVPYPRIWHSSQPPLDPPAGAHNHKEVRWRTLPLADDPAAIAALAVQAAQRGARVLIVRNTVDQAIKLQKELENRGGTPYLLQVGGVPAPHHGRFAREDRKRLDEAIQKLLGKSGAQHGAIAVGTQTVEQSLDLDADLLFTDLCPMDVLLQRLGRVHRHAERTRPQGFERAQVEVLVPADKALADYIKDRREVRGPHGIGTVYRDLRILEATRRRVESEPAVVTPLDCRRLVEQALHSAVQAGLDAEDARFKTHGQQVMGEKFAQGMTAQQVISDWQAPFEETATARLEAHVTTRLGLADYEVSFKDPLPGPFGDTFQAIKIPGRLLPDLEGEPTPSAIEITGGAVHFIVAKTPFTYDRFGLRKAVL